MQANYYSSLMYDTPGWTRPADLELSHLCQYTKIALLVCRMKDGNKELHVVVEAAAAWVTAAAP